MYCNSCKYIRYFYLSHKIISNLHTFFNAEPCAGVELAREWSCARGCCYVKVHSRGMGGREGGATKGRVACCYTEALAEDHK